MKEFLTSQLPLYANLIYGGLFIFIYTGTWLVYTDIKSLLSKKIYQRDIQMGLKALYVKIKIRRMISLGSGLISIGLYFWGKNMTVIVAIMFGAFLLDSMFLAGRSRTFIQSVYQRMR